MATAASSGDHQYVSVKLESPRLAALDLAPHLFGSHPVAGSWDPSKALPMERAADTIWELSCVLPSRQETMDFKLVLKRKADSSQCIVEEGPNRPLGCGSNEVEMTDAVFKLNAKDTLECKVWVETEMLSPFDLAASWKAQQENHQPSRVRGTYDVVMDAVTESRAKNDFASGLELDLEKYVVPTTPNMGSGVVYAANLTENPRFLLDTGISSNNDTTLGSLHNLVKGDASPNHYANLKKDINGRHAPPQEEQRVVFVDRGVGSPRFARPKNEIISTSNIKQDSEAKVVPHSIPHNIQKSGSVGMPAAEGAVAAAAVADQMYGTKEDRKLVIVLVGLPARGKTFTAAKLTRYLRWLGHETKHFNVGKYRRLKHGTNQTADFFRGDNKEGVEARNEVAALAMEDMLSWMEEGGQVGICDATNSTRNRRNMLMKMAEGKCKIIFVETICNDQDVLERNIRLKVQQSPDYAEQTDFEAGVRDFKERLAYYEKVYEPVEEGSYIKMIDMVSGNGGQLQINNISGYLPGRIVFFLVNCHLTPRPILLTRHGESLDNVGGRIGGDSSLSEAGEIYSRKLASFVEKRLKSERTASIWTSTLQRTILTAHPIIGFPKIQWRALDEINAGVCDGMSESAAWDFARSMVGKPYGYHNMIFSWIDTIGDNFPPPLDANLVMAVMSMWTRLQPLYAANMWNEALNKRLGTEGLDLKGIIVEAESRGMSFDQLLTIPEQDEWVYSDGKSTTCVSFILAMYKEAGVFAPFTESIQVTEFTIRDAYMLKIFEDNQARLPRWCHTEADQAPFCQILGEYRMELPEYNSIEPYAKMNENCPSLPPTYKRPSRC